ncbi:hypothetical protein [Roseomonas sp. CECT 9278]|uniref:hypothetical protein n=1 Tax=Roseomonas sp. CECT 9278 TaxID=2845823 RepID=UPI001E282B58|nr:hypothetical protein [Roseomonas sp. CECT 9278]CAH0154544.1 hypothetical protein ROS9278_00806 [Roseomonas sp. CECT 9278]
MVLRTLALVLFGLALCMGVFLGWGYPLGTMLQSGGSMGSGQLGLQRLVGPSIWNAAFAPLLTLPAWSLPTFVAVVFMLIAAMRPGKG